MMRRIAVALITCVLPLAAASGQNAPNNQQDDSTAARFIAAAKIGTSRYRDRSIAVSDGYHRVGPELPSMGEHWLNIGLILADTVDPARPPVLIYVPSPVGPVLAGAAYTRLLAPGDHYPDAPVGRAAWHSHSGFLDEEALPLHHMAGHGGDAHGMTATPNGTRLGILHLWMGVTNPAGAWVADNWALPFVRAGVEPPTLPDAAARALALAADSGRYYLDVLTMVGRLDSAEVGRLRGVLSTAATSVRGVPLVSGTEPTPDQLSRLQSIWSELWPRIQSTLGDERAKRLDELRTAWW